MGRMRKNRIGKFLGIGLSLVMFAGVVSAAFPAIPAYAKNTSGSDYEHLNVDPTGKSEGYSAVLYNNLNGLPTSEANAIAETKDGFIWIGGYSGLVRYDGNNFVRIDSISTGITSVVSLYEDSKDRLWVGTNDNGVAVMERGVVTRYNRVGGLTSSSIRSITESPNGDIYIATTHGIGIYDDESGLNVMNESQIYDEYIREVRTGADGVVYGLTQNGAIFTIENRRLTGFYDSNKLGIENIKSILPDPEKPDKIYVGTGTSRIYYGNLAGGMKNPRIINVAPLNTINSLERMQDALWICADNGIGLYQNEKFQTVDNVPMNNSIDQMLVDYEGNAWFTSSRQGVMKIVADRFYDVFENYNIEPTVVNSTCAYENVLFVGTDQGLMVLNSTRVLSELPITSLKNAPESMADCGNLIQFLDGCRIRSIVRDSGNRVWFSTYSDRGLVCYDAGKVTCYSRAQGLPSDRIRVVYERADGAILVACTGGMAVISNDSVKEVYNETSGLPNPEILTISEAENGDMLLGSDGDGIYVLNGRGVRNLGVDDGLNSAVILRIKKDEKRGIYWIVTSNSIAYMTPDYQITTIEQFPYSNNFDIVENSKNELWVLSSNGVYVVDADEMLANGEINPVYYNRNNGLSVVSTANSYSDITDNGDLYISGTTGISRVNIESEFEDVSDIKIAVPFIEADGVEIYPDENGRFFIPQGVKKVTVNAQVFTYALVNPVVKYKLEGFDKEYTSVLKSDFEPLVYTNLKGGKYNFKMYLKNSEGVEGEELSVEIEKEKSVYEKLWFRIFAVVTVITLTAGIALLIVRQKMESLAKQHEKDKVFIREMCEAFAKVIDVKDTYTNGHSKNVARYTEMLAKELGYDEDTQEKYYNIALLHDMGKISIPTEVLNKPGKLTDEEFAIIKSHSSKGHEILKDISVMPELADGAWDHHERPDGKGYPRGLKGDQIPRVAQIIAVADTFDAMYSDRPYRKRMNFEKAVSIIREVSGTQLAPDVVDAFLRLVDQGEFRAPDDNGEGGSMEDINNIHKKQNEAAEKKANE